MEKIPEIYLMEFSQKNADLQITIVKKITAIEKRPTADIQESFIFTSDSVVFDIAAATALPSP